MECLFQVVLVSVQGLTWPPWPCNEDLSWVEYDDTDGWTERMVGSGFSELCGSNHNLVFGHCGPFSIVLPLYMM